MTNEEKIIEILAAMQADMAEMKGDISTLGNTTTKINVRIENDIMPRLNLLAEGHTMLAEKLAPKDRVEALEDEVKFLKSAFIAISDELQQLKKAQ